MALTFSRSKSILITVKAAAQGSIRITFACDLSGRYNPYPMVEPFVRETNSVKRRLPWNAAAASPYRPDWQPLLLGMVVANAVGGALLAGSHSSQADLKTRRHVVIWPSFFLIPFIVGIVAAWFWRRLGRRSRYQSSRCLLFTFLVSLARPRSSCRKASSVSSSFRPLLYVFLLTRHPARPPLVPVERLQAAADAFSALLASTHSRRIALSLGKTGRCDRSDPDSRHAG